MRLVPTMSIRRLLSIGVLLFLNLIVILYYNHQSRMTPLLNATGNENEFFKNGRSSSFRHTGNNVNDTEITSSAVTFVVDKFLGNATNETIRDDDESEVILPVSFPFTINPHDLCWINIKTKFTLLILVCSAVANFNERQAIRETWGSIAINENNTGSVRLAFLLGKTSDPELQNRAVAESISHGDLIQRDFLDSYRNLTLKSLMLLQWVSDFCPMVHYVLKTDDDMYVNAPNLIKTLMKLPTKSNVIYGTLFRRAKPNRNPQAKWFVPKEQFDGDVFPDYLSGTGYAMSRDVVPKLLEASSTVPFMVMEDVFITGICASQRKVKRYNVRGFAYWKRLPTGCAFKDAITGHHVAIPDMRKIWKQLHQSHLVCPLPKKVLKTASPKNAANLHHFRRKF